MGSELSGGTGARVLYISYDGLMEPLGQSQVLQYQKKLARDHDITLVTFEKEADWRDAPRRAALAEEVRAAGIRWHPMRYHKRPSALATAWDISAGIAVCAALVRRHQIQVVHARSYVSSVIALALKRMLGTRFIFDMRGLWPDERVDGGIWSPESRVYRTAKWYEERFFTSADVVVSLTRAGAAAIRAFPYLAGRTPPMQVIPTCVNLQRFRPMAEEGGERRGFTLGYVGSVGTWYLFDSVLDTFATLLEERPDARLRILNRGDHAYVRERLAARSVPADRVELAAAEYGQVAAEMARMDAGIFFYKPTFSRLATAPTKMGEFLACGVPCLGNARVGDVEEVLEGNGVGVVLHELTPEARREGVRRLLAIVDDPATPARCVEVAHRYFSLEDGVASYDQIYRSLAAR